jgi:hypothetical protein
MDIIFLHKSSGNLVRLPRLAEQRGEQPTQARPAASPRGLEAVDGASLAVYSASCEKLEELGDRSGRWPQGEMACPGVPHGALPVSGMPWGSDLP